MAVRKVANNLPELRRQLELTHGTASKGSMKRESDIDKDSLSSQWQITKAEFGNNFSALGETMRGPMMAIMKSVGGVLQSIRGWIEANPALVAAIMKTVAAIGAILTVLGSLMLALGAILGPMALVRLSFTTLAGEGGIAKLLTSITRLGGAFQWLAGSPMQALLTAGRAVFGPLITLLAGISAPVWGLIALFAGVAIAIIQFWQPIKAFFSGFFTGLMQGLQPIFSIVSAVFSPLVPIFDAIISALSTVWDWFTKLFEPIQFSTEALKSCTSAGESFGKIVGEAISLVLWPVEQLWKGLDLVLEKLGLIPDQAERAKKAVEQVNTQKKLTGLADTLAGDLKAVTAQSKKEEEKKEQKRKTEQSQQQQALANNLKGPANLAPKISGSLDKIASNTAEKKDGPGEIVFKNKQPYIPIRGGYAEPVQQVQRQVPSLTAWMQQQAGALVSSVLPYSVQQPAARSPVSAVPSAASVAALMPGGDVFNFEININDAGQMDEQKLVQHIREEFTVAQLQAARRKRSQLTDHE